MVTGRNLPVKPIDIIGTPVLLADDTIVWKILSLPHNIES